MKKIFNILLLLSFIITVFAPVTGVIVHKMSAAVFVLLIFIHMSVHREKMRSRQWGMLGLVLFSFVSGLAGLIWEEIPSLLRIHRMSSIVLVFFMAIHIFKFYRRMVAR